MGSQYQWLFDQQVGSGSKGDELSLMAELLTLSSTPIPAAVPESLDGRMNSHESEPLQSKIN